MNTSSNFDQDALYNHINPPPSPLCPTRFTGPDHEAEEALLKNLKENHVKWHIYFNDKGFHNHISHHLLAIYALGATAPLIDAVYATLVSYQRPMVQPPQTIGPHNFNEHLGEDDYYGAYVRFFESVLVEKGVPATLQEYIFSSKFNFDPCMSEAQQPRMLNRLLAGLLHPWIHTGYGIEFGLIGQVAEGLAQACIHLPLGDALVPPSRFETSPNGLLAFNASSTAAEVVESSASHLVSAFPSLSVTGTSSVHEGTNAFTVVSRLLLDPSYLLANPGSDADKITVQQCGERLRKYADEWLPLDGPEPSEEHLMKKMEEVIWMNVVLYGIGGWSENQKFKADFLLMHLVTAALFLPSFLIPSILPMHSRRLLLNSVFSTSLVIWIARGRPTLPIGAFMSSTDAHMVPPGPKPAPHKDSLPSKEPKLQVVPNVWFPIVQACLVHPDEHLCKAQRALAHFSALYGNRPRGYWSLSQGGGGLDGLEQLDGTLFARVSGLTADKLGWMVEGSEKGQWDFDGFFI